MSRGANCNRNETKALEKNNPGICSRGNREKGGMEILSNGGNLDKERTEPTGIFGITGILYNGENASGSDD